MFKPALITALLLAGAPQESAVSLAWADAQKLPLEQQRYARFLDLSDVPLLDRPRLIKVLTLHVNQLSTSADLVTPAIVGDGQLLRLITTDYGEAFAQSWEKLVSPFDHQTLDVVENIEYGYTNPSTKQWNSLGAKRPTERYGYTVGGVWHEIKVEQRKTGAAKKVTAIAFWVAEGPEQQKKLKELVGWMGGTRVPMVRARWFLSQTSAQADRSPGYYDFVGVKDEATFQALIGFDPKRKSRRVEFREAVNISGVTEQPRAIERRDADGGPLYRTYDFRLAIDELDPLEVLGDDIERAFRDPKNKAVAATEQYGPLPNDLWAFFLGNNAGERADSAPDFIAKDSTSVSNDPRVHICKSCVRCHTNGGLQSVSGWAQRNLFPGRLELKVLDYHLAQRLRQQYGRDLTTRIEDDRVPYNRAVKRLSGWNSKEFAAFYARELQQYEDRPIDVEQAALELGCTPKQFTASIDLALRANRANTKLASFMNGDVVPRKTWEKLIPAAHLTLRGLAAP